MKNIKQKVYIVVEYNKDNVCRVDNIYKDEDSAVVRIVRLKDKNNSSTFHVLKKSVQGTESLKVISDAGFIKISLEHKDKNHKRGSK